MSEENTAPLEARFVMILSDWNGPFVSGVGRPWWIDLLEFMPPDEPGTSIMRRVVQALEPLLSSTKELPGGVARNLGLGPAGTVGGAAKALTAVLEEEAQAWIEGREPDYSRFSGVLVDGASQRAHVEVSTVTVDLYTPDERGWPSRPMQLQAVPALGHWIAIDDEYLRVTAVVHRQGSSLEVYAVGDDFAKILG